MSEEENKDEESSMNNYSDDEEEDDEEEHYSNNEIDRIFEEVLLSYITSSSINNAASAAVRPPTTPTPYSVTLAEIAFHAGTDGCSLGTILRIFLNNADYALFVANGNSFAGLGGGAVTTCTAIARDHLGNPITDYLFDNANICWKLTTGNFRYNDHQC